MGCQRDKEALVQAKVAERVRDFRIKYIAERRQAFALEVEHVVDSLLLLEAKGGLEDSLARLRPYKPLPPPIVPPIDSLAVHPIFEASQLPGSGN